MKGQIFVITSIMILLSLFLIRINTVTFEVKEDKLFYENFDNLRSELVNTIELSIINQENIGTNMDDFITFSTDVLKQKGFDENIDYSVTINGNQRIVNMNISLKSDKSEILENLIINRTVYT